MTSIKVNDASVSQKAASSHFHVFKVVNDKQKSRERARFDPIRRREVKDVRKIRACLRCSLLKIRCSAGDICTRCSDLVLHTHEKVTLSFSGCVRTRLIEVSIFEDALPPADIRDSVLLKTKELAFKSINLNYASQVTWNLPALAHDVVDWLIGAQVATTSKVGTLSSPNFMELVEPYIGFELMLCFQRMLYAESLAYIQPTTEYRHHISISELRQIGAFAGHRFLRFLDGKLRPQSLKECSKEDLYALLLLLIGTILAVGYTEPMINTSKQESSNNNQVHRPQVSAMQDHLCQILAHYVVFIGSHLGLPISRHTEQLILESATARWHKQGIFEWAHTPGDDLQPTESLDARLDLPTTDNMYRAEFSGDASIFNWDHAFEGGHKPFDSFEGFESFAGPSISQITHSNSPVAVEHDPLSLSCHQETLSRLTNPARENFNYWNSKWGSTRSSTESLDSRMFIQGSFVPKCGWGVKRELYQSEDFFSSNQEHAVPKSVLRKIRRGIAALLV